MAKQAESARRILVVDDDAPAREALAIVLRLAGYVVIEAANGREAIDWLRANAGRPDLILLDLMMPVMDGWQFHWALRKQTVWSVIPVVLCTGAGDSQLHADTLGTAGWINKPIDPAELFPLLQRLLNDGA